MGAQSAASGLRTLRRHLTSGRLLEVGSGDGQFLKLASDSGFECEAVEASPSLAGAMRERGLPVRIGTLEDLDLPEQAFDAFLSFHVIEHVPDAIGHMKKAAKVVKPGGIAVLATPNTRCLQHRLTGVRSPAYSAAHLRLFSSCSLGETLNAAGWEVICFETRDPGHEWIRVGTSMIRSVLSRNVSVTEGAFARRAPRRSSIAVLKAFELASWPLRRAQEAADTGAELIVIARRP